MINYKELNKKIEIKTRYKKARRKKHKNILGDFAKILECAKNEIVKERISELTKIDKHYIVEYVDFLLRKKLLKAIPVKTGKRYYFPINPRNKYKITKKGLLFLKKYYEIKRMLD
ncbi:MAG: hypothetical protein QW272_08120 [Candidatus Methanomethylicaceae archaeon]